MNRNECCGIRPDRFEGNLEHNAQLKGILKFIRVGDCGYSRHFECSICGQKWKEIAIPAGQAEIEYLEKSID